MTPPARRRTPVAPVTLAGTALFSGAPSTLTVRPALAGTGLIVRTPLGESPATIEHLSDAPAHPVFVGQRPRCTSIEIAHSHAVAMTEHALAALAGLGITDAILESDAAEFPIDDGSARSLTELLLDAGITVLDVQSDPIVLREPIEFRRGDAVITAEPCDTIDYSYHLDYGPQNGAEPYIVESTARWLGDPDDFRASIAPARTYSTAQEAEQAHALGLFSSFSPADLLVIGPDGPIDNTLRFPDECARHKLLDLIGDLVLLGRPLLARVRAHRSGHADTHELCRMIRAAT